MPKGSGLIRGGSSINNMLDDDAEKAVLTSHANPVRGSTMKPRSLPALLLIAGVLLVMAMWGQAGFAAAQDEPARVQRITDRLHAGEIHVYLLKDLQTGDRLTFSMKATSGDLDPALGIMDTSISPQEVMTRMRADVQSLVAKSNNPALALNEVRNKHFLAWDDDSGDGYAAAFQFDIPASGDYALFAASSLSVFGRATAGEYDLLIGLDAPGAQADAEPGGAPIAERIPGAWGVSPAVEEASGTLTGAAPTVNLKLVDIDAGETLVAYVEASSGNLVPTLVLRDYGGKALQANNLDGQEPQAALQYTMTETAVGHTLEVRAAALPDGTVTEGDYRLLVGLNAPDVLTGQAQPQGDKVFALPSRFRPASRSCGSAWWIRRTRTSPCWGACGWTGLTPNWPSVRTPATVP